MTRTFVEVQQTVTKVGRGLVLVLMAVTLGGEAFGVLGMLLSVPVCAVLYSLYLEFIKSAQQQMPASAETEA